MDRSQGAVSELKARIAVVSPFLDKSHGTERIVVEWISHLSSEFEFHIYSQRVDDVDLSNAAWHRIPRVPGPHLLNFLWWFVANRLRRAWDRHFRDLSYDITFSPGPNCLNADAISIHIVFAEFVDRLKSELEFRRTPFRFWPRLIHRRLYYQVVILIERLAYTNPQTQLILTARQSEQDIKRFYGGAGGYPLVSTGLDHRVFNAARRGALRAAARVELGLQDSWFAILLIGNDLRKKGIRTALTALRELGELPICLLVVSEEEPAPFLEMIPGEGLKKRVHFLRPRKDVEFYYAAADTYVAPSLEDTFALPAFEAMACGLPVIASARAGASELITEGVNGMILDDPTDASMLAAKIRHLARDGNFRVQLGQQAAASAQQYSWDRSSKELAAIFRTILERKGYSTRRSKLPDC